MLRAIEVARYFLALDTGRNLFTKDLIDRNGKKFYEGSERLNKYLHIAQNLYIAKTGEKLFSDDLFAFDNGAVVPSVRDKFMSLYYSSEVPSIPAHYCEFLAKIYKICQNASIDELIEISHEDNEWCDKNPHRENQRMNSLKRAHEYKEQYKDMLCIMDKM